MSPSPVWPALPVATGGSSGRRVQYAALPYRVRRDGEVQIRLITSRETRRWVIPKGWPMKGLSPPKAAAREAYEEAGLVGVISREPLGMYTYEKRLGTRSVLCDVLVFPLKVKRLLEKWPERFQRYGFWFSIDSAAAAVQEEDLSELIRSFGEIMARKWEAERLEAEQKTKAKAAKDKPASAERGDEVPTGERESAVNPAKAKGTKAKPDKARSQKTAQVGADVATGPAVEPQAASKAKPDKIKADKSKPDKVKAEKANPTKGVKAKSEKAAKAKARAGGGATVAAAPAGHDAGMASEPISTAKKAAKGKGGKAARKGAQASLPATPDEPPPVVVKAGRDAATVAVAKARGRPIRKAAVPKKAETVTKPGWMPEKQAPSAKKVTASKKASAVKKGATVRKAAPAKAAAAKSAAKASAAKAPAAKAPAGEEAKGGAAKRGSRNLPKGASAGKRKAKAPPPSEKPGS
ncbi:NUDIX hydrolase [Xanthobacter sp. DSM 14520]|uniref:NUDIX hydrolase n=1 Tax=Xanthobacter autotrophicus (strain ATCC BAA-1158 / Py2) TaxID=78245 RepID=UPI00372B6EE3